MEFSAQQIAMLLGGKIMGDANRKVSDVGPIESAHEGQLSFLCDAKYLPHLPQTGASVVLMTDSIVFDGETNATLIRVENARAAMAAPPCCPKDIESKSFIFILRFSLLMSSLINSGKYV